MNFSLKNGLKIAWHNLHDSDSLMVYIFLSFIGLSGVGKIGWRFAISWWIFITILYIFVRCFYELEDFGIDKNDNN